eukprot:1275039-Rhodomonas_salina.1
MSLEQSQSSQLFSLINLEPCCRWACHHPARAKDQQRFLLLGFSVSVTAVSPQLATRLVLGVFGSSMSPRLSAFTQQLSLRNLFLSQQALQMTESVAVPETESKDPADYKTDPRRCLVLTLELAIEKNSPFAKADNAELKSASEVVRQTIDNIQACASDHQQHSAERHDSRARQTFSSRL